LFLKGDRCFTAKCAVARRNFAPGMHGERLANARLTGYGLQLREKQTAKKIYNLRERQFRNYFDKAARRVGDTGQFFFEQLELRLDNVIYKLGWAKSMRNARQLVNHGHFLVNGKKVDIPSYEVRINDLIAIRKTSSAKKVFADLAERLKTREFPNWLFFDPKELSAKIIDKPALKNFPVEFDIKAIIEFYSK
jgi:small subunit ribosomal protein S4